MGKLIRKNSILTPIVEKTSTKGTGKVVREIPCLTGPRLTPRVKMSTRIYPLYQRGNPQLRIFLPNFWMKLIQNKSFLRDAPNVAQFRVSNEMTAVDIKNYLQQIYKIPVVNVQTFNKVGPITISLDSPRNAAPQMPQRYEKATRLNKGEDIKIAQVFFPKDFKFKFPDVTKNPEEKGDAMDQTEKAVAMEKQQFRKSYGRHAILNRRGAPNFFGL